MKELTTQHGKIELPAFMPDATYGSIKAVSFKDAKNAGVQEIVTTTLHIEQKIGSQYIKEIGGLHKFFNWDRPILTDSGGWQVFSLINSKSQILKNKRQNFITDVGCSFIDPNTGNHALLTPESSQVIQDNLGSDIRTVLDNPILGDASFAERKECVRINTLWAKRSKKKFSELTNSDPSSSSGRMTNKLQKENSTLSAKGGPTSGGDTRHSALPLLGAVIQGGNDFELRKISADELIEIDFDIYNFGGMPLHTGETWRTEQKKGFYHEMLHYVSSLIPEDKIKYAMGVGQPDDIAYCVDVGWNLFDTVLPTRNARHGYLYVSQGQGESTKSYKNLSYDVLHLKTDRYKFDNNPVDANCDCECCKTVSRAYLRHLLRIGEAAGLRLASIHNLRFYARWMDTIRKLKIHN